MKRFDTFTGTMGEKNEKENEENTALVGQKSRPATMASEVGVPLIQAGITGIIAGLIAEYIFQAQEPMRVALIVCGITWGIQMINVNRLLWAAEKYFKVDLNKDGYKGKPPLPSIILNNRPGARFFNKSTQVATVEPSPHPFERFIIGCGRIGTDSRKWEGSLGRSTYNSWRDMLIEAGWARWSSYDATGEPNRKQGWVLTATAEEILRETNFE